MRENEHSEQVNSQRADIVSIHNLWAGYDNESVLEDINLVIKENDFIGLIGPNGGGKTTLVKVILGLLQPSRGEILIMGKSVVEGRKRIGYVPQVVEYDRQFPISVWDVVRMGRLGRGCLFRRYSSEDDDMAASVLQQVDMLQYKNRSIGDLSGGQRQRVYFARALVSEPALLLLDEPTSSVDPQVSESIFDLLDRLNETVTILIISHDMSAISSYVKTVGCLNRRLFYHGEMELTQEMLAAAYHCPVDLIAHGIPHRVLKMHD